MLGTALVIAAMQNDPRVVALRAEAEDLDAKIKAARRAFPGVQAGSCCW
jgi:hypothetical protein